MSEIFDAIIIGAGAAGLMCALTAGQRRRRVLLIDHLDKPGSKILISGGGRCNFTNLGIAPDRFLSNNPHFAKSALSRYTQHDFIALVERHGISYHEKTLGQLFCDGSARSIVNMLVSEAIDAGVDLRVGHTVTDIHRNSQFHVTTNRGSFSAPALVLATGGPSIPKMGATGFAYNVARSFGLSIIQPRPALVPLTTASPLLEICQALAGLSVEVIISFQKQSFRENLLFTHRGLSGPAILQISSYWWKGEELRVDFTPDIDALNFLKERKKSRPKAELKTILSEIIPARLAQVFSDLSPLKGEIANISDATLSIFADNLKKWRMIPEDTEGFAKAEVTAGGIDTACLSSKTMEAKIVPGLYVIGEAVDVTGWLGGYNFQWAWSSGWCAGQAL